MAITKQPYEVLIQNPFTGTKIVAEYRGEIVRDATGWPKYKIYHPVFGNSYDPPEKQAEAFCWVTKIFVMGPSPSKEEVIEHLNNSTYEESEQWQ